MLDFAKTIFVIACAAGVFVAVGVLARIAWYLIKAGWGAWE